MADSQTGADNGTDDEEQPDNPRMTIQPNSRIRVTAEDISYAGDLGSDVAQNSNTFILDISELDVIRGTFFVNDSKPDDGTMGDVTGEDEGRSTDYRVVSEDSGVATFVKGSMTTDEVGDNVYDEGDTAVINDVDETTALFLNGMTGNRVGRTLDFSGRNYARWTDTPYLVKGLFQCHPDWRGANGGERGRMAGNGKAPRVARPPIARWQATDDGIDEDASMDIVIDVSVMDPSNPESGYEVHVFAADQMNEEFGSLDTDIEEMDTDQYGLDVDSVLGFTTHDNPEAVLEAAEYPYVMYESDEWGYSPDNWALEYDDGSDDSDEDYGIDELVEDSTPSFEERKDEFVSQAVAALPDGADPEAAFPNGVSGLVDAKFPADADDDDVADIREGIYEQTQWLSAEDLDE